MFAAALHCHGPTGPAPVALAAVERSTAKAPSGSFVARDETFAHMLSAVIAAGENRVNPRYSVVVLAGLSAEATTRTPAALFQRSAGGANVIVLPNGQKAKALVIDGAESSRRAAK